AINDDRSNEMKRPRIGTAPPKRNEARADCGSVHCDATGVFRSAATRSVTPSCRIPVSGVTRSIHSASSTVSPGTRPYVSQYTPTVLPAANVVDGNMRGSIASGSATMGSRGPGGDTSTGAEIAYSP